MDCEGIGAVGAQIERLTKDAIRTTVLSVPDERKGVYLLINPRGEYNRVVAEPGWKSEKLETPEELKRFIGDVKREASAVFYTEDRVVFVYDRNDRRDVASVGLRISPQFAWLAKEQRTPTALNQFDIVRLLRVTFRGCLPEGSQILPLLRKLKWTANGGVEGDVQHGRESLGRNVVNEVTGLNAIPEDIVLSVPVFENFDYVARVACALEVFPAEQTFRITPYPLVMKRAMDEAMAALAGLYQTEGMPPVYRGLPY